MVSNICYFHPYLWKWSNFTHIFQMVWLNHQVEKNPPHQRQGRSVTELVWCRWSSFQRCRFQTMTSRGRWLESGGMQWDCFFKKKMVSVMVSIIFYFHPYLGKWSNLTNIFQMGWSHKLVVDTVRKGIFVFGVTMSLWGRSRSQRWPYDEATGKPTL